MIAKQKVVQSLIQALIEVSDLVIKADDLAQGYKAKFVALNPDLTDTVLTSAQMTAINSFLSDLTALRNNVVVTTVQSKEVPSHGTGALDA